MAASRAPLPAEGKPSTGCEVWKKCCSCSLTRPNSAANNRVELWGAVSADGGLTFTPNVKISAGSTSGVGLGSGNELGDYLGLDYSAGVFYPVWADDSNSTGDNPNGTANLDYYGARVTVTPVPEPASLAALALAAAGAAARRRRRTATQPSPFGTEIVQT